MPLFNPAVSKCCSHLHQVFTCCSSSLATFCQPPCKRAEGIILCCSSLAVCTGVLPAELARLPNLAFLDLSNNQLTGSLQAFGAALTGSNNLLQVNLGHNKLSGDVPASLQQLAAVRPVRVTMKDG